MPDAPATELCRFDGEEMTWARPVRDRCRIIEDDNFVFFAPTSCEGKKEKLSGECM